MIMLYILLITLGLSVFFFLYGKIRGRDDVMDDWPALIINLIILIIVVLMAIYCQTIL